MKAIQKSKRTLCLLLCILFMISNMAYAESMSGATSTSANEAGVKRMISQWIDKGYISKYKVDQFKPDEAATKAEVSSVVNQIFGLTAKTKTNFSDVKKKDAYYNDLAIAKQMGYFIAAKNGAVSPQKAITRQELAFVIMKVMKLEKPKNLKIISLLKDGKKIGEVEKYAVEAVLEKGLMPQKVAAEFNPKASVTLGETFTILDRCLETVIVSYDKAGTYKIGNVAGSVMINAPDVVLQDAVIKGNLIIGKQVGEGNVTLKNVTVKGDTIVNGGGMNSIVIENCKMYHIIVMKVGNMVRVVAVGTTSATSVEMNSGGKLEEKDMAGPGFGSVVLSEEIDTGAPVSLIGDFGVVEIQGSGIGVNFSGGTVDSLTVSESAANTSIKLGGNAVLSNMTVNASTEMEGAGKIAAATINGNSVSLGVTGETAISSLNISATSKDSAVTLGAGTTVANLSVDSASNVSGAGKIGTATVNSAGAKITAPTTETKNTVTTNTSSSGTTGSQTSSPSTGGGGGGGSTGGNTGSGVAKIQIAGTITVTGELKVGAVLTASAPTTDKATVTYQWKKANTKDGVFSNILNATSNIYTPVTADAGKYIKVTVAGVGNYTGELSSLPQGPIITRSIKTYKPITFVQTGDIANLNVQCADSAAVIAALPLVASVTLEDDISLANVPLIWTDTDHYSKGIAGEYTFTAAWGKMPAGVDNDEGIAPPVLKVKVAAGKIELCKKASEGSMPTSEIKLKINDKFADEFVLWFDGVELATAKNGIAIVSTEVLRDLTRVEILHEGVKKKATEILGNW